MSLRFLLALLALGATAAPLRAQPAPPAPLPKKEVSEPAAAGFAKIQPLLNEKKFPAALALVDPLLAAAAPASYDAFLLHQLKAQVLLASGRYTEAIPPLETAHALAERNANFFEFAAHLDRLQLLAQLRHQAAAEQKDPARQRAGYEQALAAARDWIARAPRPSAEMRFLAGSLLYQLALLGGSPDAARLREAAAEAREALLLDVALNTQAQLLLVACHQQLGENGRAAELLELLVERDPKNAGAWQQLQQSYLAEAAGAASSSAADGPARARAFELRALHTLDRAQSHGHLATARDHATRLALLFRLGQFSRAAALLEKGLAAGTLENSRRHWELLASAHREAGREADALAAHARAVRALPDDGALELAYAQLLHNSGQTAEAYARGRSALGKTGIEKRGQSALFLAYLAYELQRHDEAAAWLAEARAAGDARASDLAQLERAVAEALAAREALKKPQS